MIRKATLEDIKPIHSILKYYGDRGELLARPLSRLYDHLRDFIVFESPEDKSILGCCGLQICWEDLAEIRSFAVHHQHVRKKIGTAMLEEAFREAHTYKIKKLFTLTYKPYFFQQFGFIQIDKSELPIKIWSDCIHCIKYPDCDEIAMLKILG